MKVLLAFFLAAHALIHLSYITPAPARTVGPEWPFEMSRSWLVSGLGLDAEAVRPIGMVLVIATVALLAGAGLATLGWIVPVDAWPLLTAAGAGVSLVTLTVFFHPWIVLGFLIDGALLWAALVAHWSPGAVST
jgi:hypothetical protein